MIVLVDGGVIYRSFMSGLFDCIDICLVNLIYD